MVIEWGISELDIQLLKWTLIDDDWNLAEYLLKDGKVVKDAKSWDFNQKCCITFRNLQLIIRMNRATVWSLQKMECDSYDFFLGRGGGQSQPLRLSVSSIRSNLPGCQR